MKKNKIRYIILTSLILSFSLPARADFYGPPASAIIGIAIGVFLISILICSIIALVIKRILEYFRKEKRTHIWFQTILMMLFAGIIIIGEEKENMFHSIEQNFSYDARVFVGKTVIIACLLIGCIIGYFITPKKNKE